MELLPLPGEGTAVGRFVDELWLPYHRTLEATVEGHALAEDVDLLAEEVAARLDRVGDDDQRTWVAVDDGAGPVDLATSDAKLAGFVSTGVDRSPSVFDRPDRLSIDDLFVREPYRGTGLSRDLVREAVEHARESGCTELALDVHVDNERAVAFYERLGFEPFRRRMLLDVDELE